MLDIIYSYWPKIVAALWFASMNTFMLGKSEKSVKRNRVLGFFVLFLISSAFISILGEFFLVETYTEVVYDLGLFNNNMLVFVPYAVLLDCLLAHIGGMLFSKYTGLWNYIGATIYMEYVCIEHLSSVLSVSPWSYFVIYVALQVIVYLIQRKELEYVLRLNTIQWKRIFFYLVGLFLVLDLLYGAYFIFPQLVAEQVDVTNLLWLDAIAVFTSAFAVGYMKLSFSEAKQIDKKLSYMAELHESQEGIIVTLSEISEAKSGETGQHIRRVAEYSRLLAQRVLDDPEDIETIRMAAMMHDIGKLLVSQDILGKPGKLTDEEYEKVKMHAQYGWDLLANSEGKIMEMARIIALQHHERWDGTGYPSHLKGDEISIYAQIVAVTDVYDALTSRRSYKDAWAATEAKQEIVDQRGEQFSPAIVDAFLACYSDIEKIRMRYVDKE